MSIQVKIEITANGDDVEVLMQSAIDRRLRQQKGMEVVVDGQRFNILPETYQFEMGNAYNAVLRVEGYSVDMGIDQ